MLKPHGVATWTDRESGRALLERDTVRCGHCGAIVFVKPGTGATVYLLPDGRGGWREEPGAGCRVCMSAVCLRCCADGRCRPLEERFSALERRPG